MSTEGRDKGKCFNIGMGLGIFSIAVLIGAMLIGLIVTGTICGIKTFGFTGTITDCKPNESNQQYLSLECVGDISGYYASTIIGVTISGTIPADWFIRNNTCRSGANEVCCPPLDDPCPIYAVGQESSGSWTDNPNDQCTLGRLGAISTGSIMLSYGAGLMTSIGFHCMMPITGRTNSPVPVTLVTEP